MTERQLVVVDLETTGLDTDTCHILEIAAVNVTTGREFYLAPFVPQSVFADPNSAIALSINRYFERRVFEGSDKSNRDAQARTFELREMLRGNTFAGSNPTFDFTLLRRDYKDVEPHHRLADLAPYAAAALGIPPTELPGLAKVCELLGVENTDPHSAMGDARATAECFRILMAKGGQA